MDLIDPVFDVVICFVFAPDDPCANVLRSSPEHVASKSMEFCYLVCCI